MDVFCPIDFMEIYETLQLALWKFGLERTGAVSENCQLETLCNKLGNNLKNAHDALSDIRANSKLAKAILSFFITGRAYYYAVKEKRDEAAVINKENPKKIRYNTATLDAGGYSQPDQRQHHFAAA